MVVGKRYTRLGGISTFHPLCVRTMHIIDFTRCSQLILLFIGKVNLRYLQVCKRSSIYLSTNLYGSLSFANVTASCRNSFMQGSNFGVSCQVHLMARFLRRAFFYKCLPPWSKCSLNLSICQVGLQLLINIIEHFEGGTNVATFSTT